VTGVQTCALPICDIACLLVSDMVSDIERDKFKDYFVRVRGATEPVSAY